MKKIYFILILFLLLTPSLAFDNSAWGYQTAINVSNPTVNSRIFEPVRITLTNLTLLSDASNEIRVTMCSLANTTDCSSEIEIPSEVLNTDDSTWAEILFFTNVTGNAYQYYMVYDDNDGTAIDPEYTDEVVVDETGDDTVQTNSYGITFDMSTATISDSRIGDVSYFYQGSGMLGNVGSGSMMWGSIEGGLCTLNYDGKLYAQYSCESSQDATQNGVLVSGETGFRYGFYPKAYNQTEVYGYGKTHYLKLYSVDANHDKEWYYDSTHTNDGSATSSLRFSHGYLVNDMTFDREYFLIWDVSKWNSDYQSLYDSDGDILNFGFYFSSNGYMLSSATHQATYWNQIIDTESNDLNADGLILESNFLNPVDVTIGNRTIPFSTLRTLSIKLYDTSIGDYLGGFNVRIYNDTTSIYNTTLTNQLVLSNNTVLINSNNIVITKIGYITHLNSSFVYNNSESISYTGYTAPHDFTTITDSFTIPSPIYVNDPFYYTARANVSSCNITRYNSSHIIQMTNSMTQILDTLFVYSETINQAGSYYTTIDCNTTYGVLPVYVLTSSVSASVSSVSSYVSTPVSVNEYQPFYIIAKTNKTSCDALIYNSTNDLMNNYTMVDQGDSIFSYRTLISEQGSYYIKVDCDGSYDATTLTVVYIDLLDNLNFWDIDNIDSYELWGDSLIQDYYLKTHNVLIPSVNESSELSYMGQVYRDMMSNVYPFVIKARCWILGEFLIRRKGTEKMNMSWCYNIANILEYESKQVFDHTDNGTDYDIAWVR